MFDTKKFVKKRGLIFLDFVSIVAEVVVLVVLVGLGSALLSPAMALSIAAIAAATGSTAGRIGLILTEIRDLESNARLNRRLQDLTAPGSASRGHSAQLQRAGG